MIQPFEIALFLGILFLCIEILTSTYISLSFSIGLFGVSIVEVIMGGFSIDRDIFIFLFLTIIAFVGLRKLFGRKGDSVVVKGDINQY